MTTSTPASDLGRAGQVVAGKFRLDTVIGRGGMGSVWSATHVGLGHRLALKLISRQYVRSHEALRRFDAEARAAARLQSRHVVQVFDNGTLDDGTPFIAMELLSGDNVSERIERRGPMPLVEVVEVMAQCCKALGRAHAAGIIHRDIKPDNVFLAREPDEDADVVKILDFGVAKMALDLEGGSQITETGALLGTPLYMSPEQIRGARDVDLRADLYSLGLVAYTMLTGRPAISGETFGDLLINICTKPLPSLLAGAPSLPPAMEAWFQKACAREPGDRYASAQELVDALRAAAGVMGRANTPVPGRLAAPLGDSVATGPTLAAPGPSQVPPDPRPVAVAVHATPPVFSQSAAAVSVTAAGLPRRRSAFAMAGWVVAVILAVGGTVVFLVAIQRSQPAPASDPPAATQPASAAAVVPPPVTATATASVVLAPPAEEAGKPAAGATARVTAGQALPPVRSATPVTTATPRPVRVPVSPGY
jgi:serine/threonine-protein kinase